MALTDSNDMVMPVAPMYGGGYGGGMGNSFGGDWGWIILLLLIAGNGWGNGFGGGFGGADGMFPWLMTGQAGINANTNAGFDNAALAGTLEIVDTLAHALKNVNRIIADYEQEEEMYSGRSYRNSYNDSSYRGRSYDDGRSYARGRGRNAKRDSMGRYSRSDEYSREDEYDHMMMKERM